MHSLITDDRSLLLELWLCRTICVKVLNKINKSFPGNMKSFQRTSWTRVIRQLLLDGNTRITRRRERGTGPRTRITGLRAKTRTLRRRHLCDGLQAPAPHLLNKRRAEIWNSMHHSINIRWSSTPLDTPYPLDLTNSSASRDQREDSTGYDD